MEHNVVWSKNEKQSNSKLKHSTNKIRKHERFYILLNKSNKYNPFGLLKNSTKVNRWLYCSVLSDNLSLTSVLDAILQSHTFFSFFFFFEIDYRLSDKVMSTE